MKKNWFTVKELFPSIWGIAEFEHVERVISYLFVGKEKALLFDSGMGIGSMLDEVKKITKLPILVINSHCHPDHIGGNYQFSSVLGIKHAFSLVKANKGYTKEEIATYYSASQGVKAFNYAQFVKPGEIVDISPFHFLIISAPGHTLDSICLYEQNLKLLLTGDTVYNGPLYLFFKESDPEKYRKSIAKLAELTISHIFPGHNDFLLNSRVLQEISKNLEANKNNSNMQVTDKIFLRFQV